jgi:hypothetical protein
MSANDNTAPVANLRQARKAQAEARKAEAAAKQRHPAGKQAPAKQPAKKAPAKPATPTKPADKTDAPKVRWELLEERTAGNRAVPQVGRCGGHSWTIQRADGGWNVVHTDPSGKQTTLTEKPVGYGPAGKLVLAAAKAVAA